MTTTSGAAPRSSWTANGLAALFDYAAVSHRRAALLLILISLFAFLPGFFQIPPIDRDEARFAQATKQMIETGDFVDIRFQDEVRYKKPVGIYWMQAAAVKAAEALGVRAARSTIWLYRLPSLLGAVGAVLATYWCALAFVSRRGAMLAAVMMAGSLLLGVEARLAKTDAMLLFTVVTAMGVLARAYLAPRRSGAAAAGWALPALFWTALAVGVLVKGPLILMVVGLAAATLSLLERSARWLLALRPLAGFVLLLVIVLPWFVAIYARVGTSFLVDSAGRDMLGKVVSVQESHGAPPGLYFIIFFATFFPASVLAPLAAPAVWAVRREPAARFLLAWLVPSWIVFELVITKLPHYVLPLYPAIAILIAGVVETNVLSRRPWLVRGTVWWFLVPILLSASGLMVSIVLVHELALAAWPFLVAAIACGLWAWRCFAAAAEHALLRATAASILATIGIYAVVVAGLAPAFPSQTLAAVLRDSGCDHPVAASAGYQEPSLVFLAGTETRFTDASGAADFLRQGRCRFAFIDTRLGETFAQRAAAIGLQYTRTARIAAFNISNGRPVTIDVLRPVGEP